MSQDKPNSPRDRIGLCAECKYMQLMKSDRGSTFYLCGRSLTDSSFPKYPRLPVLECAGYDSRPKPEP